MNAQASAPLSAAIRYERDGDGIVTLTMDDPSGSVNLMNAAFEASLQQVVERLYEEVDQVRGVILASAKKTFFAGGDLDALARYSVERSAAQEAQVNAMKHELRRLERLGKPVVAAINGAALGGGLEVALAAHHRIAADVSGSRIGLPEVGFGLLPGGGGLTRTVRMFGVQRALTEVILPARRFTVRDALSVGLVDEIVESVEELAGAARAWIFEHPESLQPWDRPGFRLPGGSPDSASFAAQLPAMPAMLRAQLRGAPLPAPRAALAAAVEGAYVDIDTALAVETRYFVHLANGQVSKNMIKATFSDLAMVSRSAVEWQSAHNSPQLAEALTTGGKSAQAVAYIAAVSETFMPRLARRIAEETVAIAADGVSRVSIERAAAQAGYAVSPIAQCEQHSLTLPDSEQARGEADVQTRQQTNASVPFGDVQERLLFSQALEAADCLEAGAIAGVAEANIASIFGVGYPVWTGGALQFVSQHEGSIQGFVTRAKELAERYGERFLPSPWLVERASRGEAFN